MAEKLIDSKKIEQLMDAQFGAAVDVSLLLAAAEKFGVESEKYINFN